VNDEMSTMKAAARARTQRERILAAAKACFVKNGFHAASMASIAKTAAMSPGLIYRYFDNKNAIILAIMEQQIEITRCRIRQLHASKDFAARIVDFFDEHEACDGNSMSMTLYLEMSAEATRDPQIAEALRKFDTAVCSEVANWLSRGREEGGYGLPDDITQARALMLLCLIEGLKLRGVRELVIDRSLLKKALDEIIALLVASPG